MDNEIVTDQQVVMSKAEVAWEMMLAGREPHEIRDRLGYKTNDEILRSIREELKREATFLESGERRALLAMSIARLDKLRTAVWPSAMMGDPASVRAAIDIEKAVMKAEGTDIPDAQIQQHTVLVVGGQEASYVETLKELSG